MQQQAEKMFINGIILTMDERGSTVEAVAIGDGKIQATGTTAEILQLRGPNTEVIDLQGKTLAPGFIDPHSHFPMSGVQSLYRVVLNSPPVGTIRCVADMIARLKEKAATVPKGEWIIGVNYDDTLIAEKRHLTKAELDEVSSEHPIILAHLSVHIGVANSAALKLMNITPDTPVPEGSQIGKDPVTGELNGFLAEIPFMHYYFNELPPLTMEQGLQAIACAAEQYAAQGITTVQVGLLSDRASLEQLIIARNNGTMPLRVIVWTEPSFLAAIKEGRVAVDGLAASGLEFRTAKTFIDGSIQCYTAYLTKPYHIQSPNFDSAYRGSPVVSREELTAKVKNWHKRGWQIALHGNGDAAIDDILYAYQEAQKEFPRADARHVVVHSQTAREDQLDLMKELDVIPSFFSLHTHYFADRHHDIFLGPERALRIDPVKSALDRGMKFTIHTDTPVTPISQLDSVWSAVNRISTGGRVIGADQRIPALEAMRAVTSYAAWQSFEENTRGSIEPGKLADFVILSANPLLVPTEIRNIQVLETIVGGVAVYKQAAAK